jgi:hypothetical protein
MWRITKNAEFDPKFVEELGIDLSPARKKDQELTRER